MNPNYPYFTPPGMGGMGNIYGGGMGAGFPMYPGYGWGPPYMEVDYVLDDEDVEENVRDNIDLDPYIPRSDRNSIDVDVTGGIAKLTGTVRNRRSKFLAWNDAFWATGVMDVDATDLKVEEPPRKTAQEELA